jgi:glycosyltransferase involved in cell wall biosynthesis
MFVFSTVIVCISEAVGSQFSSLIRRRKLVIIHDGVPAKEFPGVSEERIAKFRRQYGLGAHSLVGVVGRIKIKRKGQDTFVKSIPYLSVEFPETRFVIIGSPFPGNEAHLSRIQEMVGGLGVADRVIYTGDVEDIQAAYAALDVCVLPSEQPEPLGLVIIEAMASRKPVVGTRIGGPCELIDDEKTGLLVTPGDPLALAVALRRLLRDNSMRKQFGDAGRLRFEQMFEFDNFYHRLEIVYSDAIAPRPFNDQRLS